MRFKELVTVIPEDVYFGVVWYEDEDENKERFWGNITKEDYSEETDKMVEQFGEYTVTRIEPHKNCLIDDYSSCLNIFVTNLKKRGIGMKKRIIKRGNVMSETKIVKNPNHDKGIYHCATTVRDLMNMLKDINPNEDVYLCIDDPRNPYGWIDIEEMEYDAENKKLRVRTTCHEF